jgi:hypothetical protein
MGEVWLPFTRSVTSNIDVQAAHQYSIWGANKSGEKNYGTNLGVCSADREAEHALLDQIHDAWQMPLLALRSRMSDQSVSASDDEVPGVLCERVGHAPRHRCQQREWRT